MFSAGIDGCSRTRGTYLISGSSRSLLPVSIESMMIVSSSCFSIALTASVLSAPKTVPLSEKSISSIVILLASIFEMSKMSSMIVSSELARLCTIESISRCLPSIPTSLATRVTSLAKTCNESTILLIVLFSCKISPWASTLIFCDRSPWATAVVTVAIDLTWFVKLLAITLTFSVTSFHAPSTSVTLAWPPRIPFVPTSVASVLTSSTKVRNRSTILLIVILSSNISPLQSAVTLVERSPLATAVVTFAMFLTCVVKLSAMALTLSVSSNQIPETFSIWACPPRRPSTPVSLATRVTSKANLRSWSTILFTVFCSCKISPWA
ncbi:hypothetical protein OGATHE_004601 [Ogataea polymorpha]|uniref:Uncharacterized protein n=1 Tax=Ogataea polymorpha TaxID=460523 RepID=A0A9P8P0T7_9ASCO|nr:hypothetical protein OGATHE_004601 [Ogataea polymorpha]